jgi:hypothetical protein
MKRILFLFVLLFSGAIAQAQTEQTTTPVSPQEEAHSYAIRMQKMLGLTEDQVVNVEAVALAKYQAIAAVNADATKTQDQKNTEIENIKREKQKEILALLTPDQVTKYNEIREQRQERQQTTGQQSGQ